MKYINQIDISEIKNNLNFKDIFYYIFIPISLIFLIHLFLIILGLLNLKTPEIESYFILDTDILNPASIFLSSYTHFGFWTHLMVNVFNYLVMSILILFLIKNKTKLKKLMIFALLILPFIIGIFNFYIYESSIVCGFSGIVYCILGFFPISIFYFNKKEINFPFTSYIYLIPIFSNSSIYLLYNKIIFGYIFFVLLLLFVYLELKNYIINKKEFKTIFNKTSSINLFVFLFSTCLCFIAFLSLIPIFTINTVTDYISYSCHLFGWINGIVISFIFLRN